MLSAKKTGYDVVNSQIPRLFAAILASVIIANKNLAPAQSPLQARSFYEVYKPDYGGYPDRNGGAVHYVRVILQDLGLASIEHYHRSPCPANIQRLVVLI
jgi:hypothetical protein